MMFGHTLKAGICAIAASGLFACPALAKEGSDTLKLEPSSDWRLHYADDSCRISRTFGEGEQKIAFYIERFEPGDFFNMLAAGRPLRSGSKRKYASVRFGEAQPPARVHFVPGSIAGYEPALIFGSTWFGARTEDGKLTKKPKARRNVFSQTFTPEAEADIRQISVQRPGKKEIVLKTGSMSKPMAAMRQCTDELLTHWGIDLEKHKNLVRATKPKGKPSDWVDSKDYPKALLRNRSQGLVRFRLSVDANGTPSACHIQQSTRPQGFDDAVCNALMRNARFAPAQTSSGEAIASYWRSTVRFAIDG